MLMFYTIINLQIKNKNIIDRNNQNNQNYQYLSSILCINLKPCWYSVVFVFIGRKSLLFEVYHLSSEKKNHIAFV